jgi:hypothetical protein
MRGAALKPWQGLRSVPAGLLLILFLTFGETAMAVEEPEYRVTRAEDAFEVREYPALLAAEVTVGGERSAAVSAGFRLLAGYIFGGNQRRQSIAMTAPVLQAAAPGENIAMTAPVTQTASAGAWIIRFMLPRSYTLDTLPKPNDAQVHITTLAPARFAVVRFSGLAREDDIALQTAALNGFAGRHQLRANGAPTLARFDPPWTLWFMRRNEIMLPLRPEGAP